MHESARKSEVVLLLVKVVEDSTRNRLTPSNSLLRTRFAPENRLLDEKSAICYCFSVFFSSDSDAALKKVPLVAVADGSIQGRHR